MNKILEILMIIVVFFGFGVGAIILGIIEMFSINNVWGSAYGWLLASFGGFVIFLGSMFLSWTLEY